MTYERVDRYTTRHLENATDDLIYLLYETIMIQSQSRCSEQYYLTKDNPGTSEFSDVWAGFYQHYGNLIEEMNHLSNEEIRSRVLLYKKERLNPTPRDKSGDEPGPLYWEDYQYKPVQLRNPFNGERSNPNELFTNDVSLSL